jgi:hypothetical protein
MWVPCGEGITYIELLESRAELGFRAFVNHVIGVKHDNEFVTKVMPYLELGLEMFVPSFLGIGVAV